MDTFNHSLQLVECPRDAMQGWAVQIPTDEKIRYINALLKCGFDTIDFGSFVSPKAIPQMADTEAVLRGLDQVASRSALLAIVANLRGAETALSFDSIRYLGFPFSVSETFQQRNANSNISAALGLVEEIQFRCLRQNKELVVYLSMGFGNPYGDSWSEEIVLDWAKKLSELGVLTLSLADTVGLAEPSTVERLTRLLLEELPGIRIGVHLHAHPGNWKEKLEAAYRAGCRRFDGAINGIGGCPMAGDKLVGNMDTINILNFLKQMQVSTGIDPLHLENAVGIANEIFSTHLTSR